ncbi:SDR family oxidoreductase [Nocardioides sp. WG-D5]
MTSTQIVVVTGAGTGVGRAISRELLDRGHGVVLAGRRRAPLDDAAAGHPAATVAPLDVADPAAVAAMFGDALARHGRVDVLVNNAGTFGPAVRIDELQLEDWEDTWRTNVTGSVVCAREAVRVMLAQDRPGGRIINNGSLSAQVPRPHSVAYAVTKHAISGLTASLALDLRDEGIAVTQVDIGNASTAMTAGAYVAQGALQPDGTHRAEPTIDVRHVATLVAQVVELPTDVAVPQLTVMARAMPFAGRG